MPTSYSDDLAHIHDAGFTGFADSAATLLLAELRDRALTSGLVVDMGCGSGALSLPVVNAGYDLLGIDLSEPFLKIARARVPDATFRCESLLDAEIPPCVAVAAIGECVNYLFDESHSAKRVFDLFKRAFDALDDRGVFLFDAAEPGRAGPSGSSRGFVEGDDWFVAHATDELTDPPRLARRITSFRREGDRYRRTDEQHDLRLLPHEEIVDELRRIGFRVTLLDGYGESKFPPGWVGFLATKD